MAPEVKFCGLTRVEDARLAVDLGADYLGMVLAPSPRRLTLDRARALRDALGAGPRWVGVFVSPSAEEVDTAVDELGLHAVQVHGGGDGWMATALRSRARVEYWRVVDVEGDRADGAAGALADGPDVLLFDTRVAGRSGGTGRAFDWEGVRPLVDACRRGRRIALAGGLTVDTVPLAVRTLSPDIVDVSSGIEVSPGVKDHKRMRAFVQAARGAGRP